jgi:hypothetical protein
MAEQTKRQELESYLAARALQDPVSGRSYCRPPSRPLKVKLAFISPRHDGAIDGGLTDMAYMPEYGEKCSAPACYARVSTNDQQTLAPSRDRRSP